MIAFDTETALMRPGVMAPELVCVTWQRPGDDPCIGHVTHQHEGQMPTALLVRDWLSGPDLLVGHHIVYDLAVLAAQWPELVPLIFAKYDRNEITCTKIRQQLLDIAAGEFRGKFVQRVTKEGEVTKGAWKKHDYTLDALTYRATGRKLDKDTWRLRYGEFIDVPISEWPEGARMYPLEDARATLDVFESQEKHAAFMPDQFSQARAAWALHLAAIWGLRTHAPGVEALERETLAALAEVEEGLRVAGLVRNDGSRDTKRAQARMIEVCAREGLTLRMTDGGAPSLDSDACEASGDDLLEDYGELTALKAVVAKDLPVLQAGVTYPVHTSFGMAGSGRSTSSKPNVQNPRRLPGIREAFVPRPGKVFAQSDFSALELHTLAQTCTALFGRSELARVLNEGRDPHTDFAASILGISYTDAMTRKAAGDEEIDAARQTAKVANFGFPGGLGIEKLVLFARKTYGVAITPVRARELKAQWVAQWPEMREFFRHVGDLCAATGEATVEQIGSGRFRGGCNYTAACNSYFQGLGADAAKRALYLASRACYTGEAPAPDFHARMCPDLPFVSPLLGARIVNFVHDEIILETDDTPFAHEVAHELARVMVLGANEYLPDVPARTEPLLARCWSKKSKPVHDEAGRLIPWAPK